MESKPISPTMHGLLTLPSLLGFNKTVKKVYTVEGLTLSAYIALTGQPLAVKPLIPFPIHGKTESLQHRALCVTNRVKSL